MAESRPCCAVQRVLNLVTWTPTQEDTSSSVLATASPKPAVLAAQALYLLSRRVLKPVAWFAEVSGRAAQPGSTAEASTSAPAASVPPAASPGAGFDFSQAAAMMQACPRCTNII